MEKGKEVKANKKGVVWRPLQSSSLHGGCWAEGENHDWREERELEREKKEEKKRGVKRKEKGRRKKEGREELLKGRGRKEEEEGGEEAEKENHEWMTHADSTLHCYVEHGGAAGSLQGHSQLKAPRYKQCFT